MSWNEFFFVVDYNKGENKYFNDILGVVSLFIFYLILLILILVTTTNIYQNSVYLSHFSLKPKKPINFPPLWQIIGIIKVNKFHMLNVYVINVVAFICVNIYHIIKT